MRSKLPVIGGAAALLAGVGIIAAIWSNGTKNSTACAPFKHAPVPAAAQKELAGYAGRIEHANEHSRGGTRDEWWDDPVTGTRRQLAFDAHGRIESVFSTIIRGRVERTVWVLYPGRTWISDQHRLPFLLPRVENDAATRAQYYRDKVANGTASVLGREVIGGHETLHLREIVHPPAPQLLTGMPVPRSLHFPTFRNDAWVDPLTYLPVRTSFSAGGGGAVTDETWLPRTPANIAKTKLVIPAGFKHEVPQQGRATGGFSRSFSETVRCRQS